MKLKALLASLEGLPKEIAELYQKQEDGTYLLDVDEKGWKDKLDEFRTNNRNFHKKVEALEAEVKKFEGVDLERYNKAVAALEKLQSEEDKQLAKDGKIEELIASKTAAMKAAHDKELASLRNALKKKEEESQTYRKRYDDMTIDQRITEAAQKVGKPKPGALSDILARARKIWTVDEEGQLVALKPNGEHLYGKEGTDITAEEWAANLMEEATHLYEPSKGSGAEGSRAPSSSSSGRFIGKADIGANLEKVASGEVTVR